MYNYLLTGCLVIVVVTATAYTGRRLLHARKASDPWREARAAVAVWLFAVGMCFVAGNTLVIPLHESPSTSFFRADQINLVPFRSLAVFAEDVTWGGGPAFKNLIGNLGLVAPVGVAMGLHPAPSVRTGIIVAVAGPAVIEVAQVFMPRSSDVDDLLLNFLGAMAGMLATRAMLHLAGVHPQGRLSAPHGNV